jgi:prevent-host-death family protein
MRLLIYVLYVNRASQSGLTMKTFTFSDMNRTPGEILDAALVEPVALTKRGKRKLVVMSAADFQKLPYRQAYTIEEAPDHVIEKLAAALLEVDDAERAGVIG